MVLPDHAVCVLVGVVGGCVVASKFVNFLSLLCSLYRWGTYLSQGNTFAQQLNLF